MLMMGTGPIFFLMKLGARASRSFFVNGNIVVAIAGTTKHADQRNVFIVSAVAQVVNQKRAAMTTARIVIVAMEICGVLKRLLTSAIFVGMIRSNDHAKKYRLGIQKYTNGAGSDPASIVNSTTKTSNWLG